MMRISWLLIAAASMLQMACIANLPPCFDPGAAFPKSCYYRLTISDVDTNTGLVTGEVEREVLKKNATRWFWQKETWPYPWGPDFDVNDYKAKFRFEVQGDPIVKEQTYDFCSVPNQWALKLAPPLDPAKEDRCA